MSTKWFCDRCKSECESSAIEHVSVNILRLDDVPFAFVGDLCRNCSRTIQSEVTGRFYYARSTEPKS